MAATARGLTPDLPYRPVRITFRLLETSSLTLDTGMGARALPLPGTLPFTGDVATRAIGWRRGTASPPWRVAQSSPRSLHDPVRHNRDQGERLMGALSSLATVGLNMALSAQAQKSRTSS